MRRGESALSGVVIVLILLGAAYYYVTSVAQPSLVGVNLTVNFSDGSTKTYTLPSGLPLGGTVINVATGTAISSIAWSVTATPTWEGTATALSITGSNVLSTVEGTASAVTRQTNTITWNTATASLLGSLGVNTFTVKSGSLTAATLEGWTPADGSKTLRFTVSLVAKMTMSSGVVSEFSGSSTVNFNYSVSSEGLTGLSVGMTSTPG